MISLDTPHSRPYPTAQLDDVILTECIGGPPGPTPGGGCKGSLAIATTSPSGKVTPFRTFG